VTPPGRRPGKRDTRADIVDAARAEFAETGYGATSLRAIARRAGVDPALVHHYFTDKVALFVAATHLPDDLRPVPPHGGGDDGPAGGAVVEGFLTMWDAAAADAGTSFVAVAQAMTASPEAAGAMREFVAERVWSMVPTPADESPEVRQRRLALVGSQLVGLAWARYILRVEPLASADRAEVARWVGPTITRYLTGDVDGAEAG
jgi:AcrR family transcriptional regulator